ncbi:LamG-like jellyroll fold domain-containing protein [Salegentibacter sp. F188]|uniref:LamG-like jellyroll fold domain-containing protein n=1 Tax=Autumnicola patrickiae TaxID=3075591 RepID=A0ABU3E551_9FLAO|nr:LamG-like jellyroll fold domain-containing protein [Salegentibacter sp. F188]MDT0691033.1 LamG-like jellyroll fold domain-containing protein [Salegentibacter sp. F188]
MGKITSRLNAFILLVFLFLSAGMFSSAEGETYVAISINTTLQDVSCVGGSDGTIDITVSGGSGGFNFSWTGPNGYTSNSEDISGLSAGTYNLTVTDNTNPTPQESSTSVAISESDNTNPTITAPEDVSTSTDTGDCIATGVNLGTPTTADNCEVVDLQNDAPSYFEVGTTIITWTVEDSAGNTAKATQKVTVSDTEKPTISAKPDIIVTNISGTCEANVSIVSASATDNCAVLDPTGTRSDGRSLTESYPVGTTIITWAVTDDYNNTADPVEQIVTVIDNEAPQLPEVANVHWGCEYTLTVPVATDNCSGEITGTTTSQTTFSTAGTYTVEWQFEDEDGNTSNLNQQVVIDPLEVEISSIEVDCYGSSSGSAEAEASGGTAPYSYTWTSLGSGASKSGLAAGTYTVSVEDANGCVTTESVTISQPDDLVMQAAAVNPVSCNGGNDGNITAGNVSGGNSGYQYSIDGTNFGTSNTFSNLSAGTYTITVRDSKGCEDQKTAIIEQPDVLTMTAPEITPVSCNGGNDGSISAGNVSGGNSGYQYSIDGTNFGTSNTFSNLSAGTYTITVRDAKGCEVQKTAIIDQPDVLTMADPEIVPVSCNGEADGSITAGAVSGGNSGYQYAIDGTDFGTANTFSNLSAGTYTVTVRDAKGCEVQKTAIIIQPDVLTMADPNINHVSCNGGDDGSISAGNVSGGNSGYTYSLDGINFGTANTFSNLSAGTYTVTVRDAKGCEAIASATITEPEPLLMNPPQVQPVTCSGASDGIVTAGEVSGGTGTYQYMITGTSYQDINSFSNLEPGSYTISVRDENACVTEAEFTVTEPSELDMTTPTSTEATCFGGSDGTVTAGTVTGGTGQYYYSIDNINFSTDKTFSGLSAGTHTIFVKDDENCALQTIVNVSEPAELNAALSKTDVNCFNGADGTITFSTPTGGHGSYEYSVDGVTWQAANTFTGLAAGTYAVSIRDQDYPSCQVILNESFSILQPEAPLTVETTSTRTTTYGTSTGTVSASPAGGATGYTYEWRRTGANEVLQITQTATNLPAGVYEVTVTDRNGCQVTAEATIIDIIRAPIIPTSICETDEDLIRTSYFEVEDRQARGGVGPYTYEWNFGADATPQTATGPGSHRVTYPEKGNKTITVTVTDSTGESITNTYVQYVGECYVDDCGSNDFSGGDFFVGDENGNRITSSNCGSTTSKYIYVDLSSAPTRYSLYIEYIYTLEKTDGTITTIQEGGEFYCKEAIPDVARTIAINDWECGDLITIDNVYLTFSNNKKWKCGQGPDPKCFSTNDGEMVSTPLYATATPNEIPCFEGMQGIIKVRASGGTPAYDYSLEGENGPFQSSREFTGLAAGTYSVWVRDSKGEIFKTTPITITQPDTPLTAEVTTNEPVCFGESAIAYVHPEGGTPFTDAEGNLYYEFLWNDSEQQTDSSATNLAPGEYTVTVIDANGCQVLENVTISQPSELSEPMAGEDQVMGCGFDTTTLEANTPEVGVGTWSIASGDAGVIEDPSNPASGFSGTAGTYILRWTITHEDGSCARYDEVEIKLENDCSTLDFDGVDDYIDFGKNYSLSSGAFTIEAWILPKSIQGTRTIMSKRNANNLPSGGFDLIINNGAPTFRWAGNAVSTSHKINTDRWYHLAVIYQNSKVTLYVDGIPVGNRTATNPIDLDVPFLIGAMHNPDDPDIPKNYYKGSIEEVRLWKSALTEEQLRFMMNQRLELNGTNTRGQVLPIDVPGELAWSELSGYYHLVVEEIENGFTTDRATNRVDGRLRNITTEQENSAPLPYYSVQDGAWRSDITWARPDVWDPPNSKGINGNFINWNIAEISHQINSDLQDIHLLGLISKEGTPQRENSTLDMQGSVNNTTGNGLTISHYLELNGIIDLNGESQLIQSEGSILAPTSSGYIEREQQGTASSYNYNYWSSPVVPQGDANNSGYTVAEIMLDGSPTGSFGQTINFGNPHTHADGAYASPRKVSNYWINAFRARTADAYSAWEQIGSNAFLKVGEGYTMKGTSGEANLTTLQNYVFKGKPNNGTISLSIGSNQNYLIGNPYPSALSVSEFFLDNLKDINGGRNDKNAFNGALYFWDHFSGKTHVLSEYVGGYAVLNLVGAVAAIATDERIDATGDRSTRRPGDFIPVGQGFFINTEINSSVGGELSGSGGVVRFKNNQRRFRKEGSNSQFLKPEIREKSAETEENKSRIRLNFQSPLGYHRQILLGVDKNTSNGFDLGYDALLNDYNLEDMFWLIDGWEYVIQGVGHVNPEQVLPIGLRIEKQGEFKILIDELENISESVEIYIRDKSTETYHDLRNSEFVLQIEPGDYYERFEVVFQKPEIPEEENPEEELPEEGQNPGESPEEPIPGNGETPEEAENPDSENPKENPEDENGENSSTISVEYLMDEKQLVIHNPGAQQILEVRIFTLNGQQLETFTEATTEKEVYLTLMRPVSTSVYVVKVHTAENIYNKKIIVDK